MAAIRKFRTTFHSLDDPDWAPLERLAAALRAKPDMPRIDPGAFMWMCAVENKYKRVVIHLYKHIDTRRYLNLDEAGHAYEYCPDDRDDDIDDASFSGHYRLHRSMDRAIRGLRLWELLRRNARDDVIEMWPDDESWPGDDVWEYERSSGSVHEPP